MTARRLFRTLSVVVCALLFGGVVLGGASPAQATDLSGGRGDGTFTLTLTGEPVYLQGTTGTCAGAPDSDPAQLGSPLSLLLTSLPPGTVRVTVAAGYSTSAGGVFVLAIDPTVGSTVTVPATGFTCGSHDDDQFHLNITVWTSSRSGFIRPVDSIITDLILSNID